MKEFIFTFLIILSYTTVYAQERLPTYPHIEIETTEGNFKLELNSKAAPITVKNFLNLVDSGFYDGTVFHRIIPGFMAQGGGFTPGFKKKFIRDTIINESGNGLSNVRGTIAMARTNNPHSASTQFFINVVDNNGQTSSSVNLDPIKNNKQSRWGYAVFGFVFDGMEVVDTIVNKDSKLNGPGGAPAPIIPIVIKKITRISYK
ncbi:MAG: hypothetical protein CMQ54_05140 [Gammaproteobacteria bacterium]|nr:hypothetical protein [Gammaproteobacteria bacterium]